MIYGAYKNVRNASWQCFIDYNVSALPVKVTDIAKQANIKVIKNSEVNLLAPNESGMSLLDGEQWYIIYNDNDSRQRSRFTIAHELGHILLGHELRKGYHARTFDISKPEVEQEADAFAARLLAPACVLWGLDLHTPDEIARICDISITSAQFRADRMKLLYSRNKFLISPLEREVYNNFESYIKKQKVE